MSARIVLISGNNLLVTTVLCQTRLLLAQARPHSVLHFLVTSDQENWYCFESLIGASLSEPHISRTALRTCVCMLACLLGARI